MYWKLASSNIGVWASLVSHSAWDRDIAGSNPATPTTIKNFRSKVQLGLMSE